jgi:uncharacterized protein
MKLTRTERWILANQYSILEKLYPDEAEYYAKCRRVLENGYEFHYDEISQNIYKDSDTMSIEASREVLDILHMFSDLKRSYEALKDKSGIEKHRLNFHGFDGNDPLEVKYLAYARFFCNSDGGRYKELNKGDDFNSHMLTLDQYRRMLAEWKKNKDIHELSKEDIIRIISA